MSNNLDKNIKNKLENRTFKPSKSAWERLSMQLDEQPVEKKRGWFFYIGIAASILLLVSIGIQLIVHKEANITPKQIIVDIPIDSNTINEKINKMFNEVPVEEAVVKNTEAVEKLIIKQEINKKIIANKEKKSVVDKKIILTKTPRKDKIVIAKVDVIKKEAISHRIDESVTKNSNILKQNPNSRIKINSEDLLFAVTNSSQEVKKYYAKYSVSREDVLKTVKSELKKSNIKVNPKTILTEVERTIDDDDFKNNFMKSLKNKISNIATSIASRNH
jgi:hypothetical protein